MKRLAGMFFVALFCCTCAAISQEADFSFESRFDSGIAGWSQYFEPGEWQAREGVLTVGGENTTVALAAPVEPAVDCIVQADVRVLGNSQRANFGILFRAQPDGRAYVLRHYDRSSALQLLDYTGGGVTALPKDAKVPYKHDTWYTLKAAVLGKMVLGKMWPAGTEEPGWQFRHSLARTEPGKMGLYAGDCSLAEFRSFRTEGGPALAALQATIAEEERKAAEELKERLQCEVRATPFVLRSENGPRRAMLLRPHVEGRLETAGGTITVTEAGSAEVVAKMPVDPSGYRSDGFVVEVPEPEAPARYRFTYESAVGRTFELDVEVKPARRWTFFINTHTHFDIGFTHPQKEILENLTADMKKAVDYCEETKDYPAESRYRWTIEGTGLLWHFINRHGEEDVADQIEWIKNGRIELCGFNYNMPCEMLGHEQLIRCLYWAQEYRRRFGVEIDTIQINDVPGWAWALPDLLSQAGIKRASFRANSIRGNFLWYRDGAVPRAFYWEGPAGGKILVWYTHTYRDANFFRSPGLHEEGFVRLIKENEDANIPFDYIQLRMGGDNLPPEINASKNAKAWNEKYVWPKLVVSTNREFLDAFEEKYGATLETHRGDVPSWWADGPASAARETGQVRLLHDRLVAIEGMWAAVSLLDPAVPYPKDRINASLEKMMLFDEHTWGASGSISQPKSAQTVLQWETKAAFAKDALDIADRLERDGRERLGRLIHACPAPADSQVVAVTNPLAWERTDLVTLPLAQGPLVGAAGVKVTDLRDGTDVPVQMSIDDSTACFVARDVPSFGYAQFAVTRLPKGPPQENTGRPVLENDFYRIEARPESGGLTGWFDKRLNRELLDPDAEYLGNQPIYERSLDGRDAISKKVPTRFERTAPQEGRLIGTWTGPVYDEMMTETSLPSVPRIRQRVRVYKELPFADIENLVIKNEVLEPEGLYFAFPFDVPKPEFRFQIADATMVAGVDQLTYSCRDFYAIGQWAGVSNDELSLLVAPLEAYLVTASDLNAYQWADTIPFDKGHLYSWVMNNCWICNFKNGQDGEAVFRYRIGAFTGRQTPTESTRFGWQPFYPLVPIWLTEDAGTPADAPSSASMLHVEGDPLVVSCVKRSETGDAVIVRLLELDGKPGKATLVLDLPCDVTGVYRTNCVEVPQEELAVQDGRVAIAFEPNEIITLGIQMAH